jgi:pimeloyl-ACP methyl ester carboxylesterase
MAARSGHYSMRAWGALLLTAALVAASGTGAPADEVSIEAPTIRAADGGVSHGLLYWNPAKRPKTVVVSMHPSSDNQRHFVLRPAAEHGYAGFGLAGRFTGKDAAIHEEVLLDLAAGIKWLKEERGFTQIVLVGHSGGGSLMAYYQSQATTAPPGRYKSTPAGDPPDLNAYTMIPADGIAILNASEGEGLHVQHHLDPSLVREDDPLSIDPSLDMYNPANGFREPPAQSKYSPDFIQRFRDAQKARDRRLTEWARSQITERNYYAGLTKQPGFASLSFEQRQYIERRADHLPVMILYRSEADLAYTDLSIDPSDRQVGSNYGPRPDQRNYSQDARVRSLRPDAYLSTMSGTASYARLHDNIRKVTVPTLVLGGTADLGIFPSEQKTTFQMSAAKDKTIVWIEGANHGFNPAGPKAGDGKQQQRAAAAVLEWIDKRFPK